MLSINSINEISAGAKQFIMQIEKNTIFAFTGNMGVGKTTFIKAICEELGVEGTVNSPTFSIVNEYQTKSGKIIYHFDCYRINKIEEAVEIGIQEYLYSGNLCFIEWPENITSLLPDKVINVNIYEKENGERKINIR